MCVCMWGGGWVGVGGWGWQGYHHTEVEIREMDGDYQVVKC